MTKRTKTPYFWLLIATLIASGCGRSQNGGEAEEPVVSPVVFLEDSSGLNSTVEWDTPFGPAGAVIPELPSMAPSPGPGGLTRVEGAIFPSSREVLFIGQHFDGEPVLTPGELLDSFVGSLRLLDQGRAPSVSIDPTSEQIKHGLRRGELMTVTYFGSDDTRLGKAMFESDRQMKDLGLGRNSNTGEKTDSEVEGYFNQLDLTTELEEGITDPSWTRFWIEIDATEIERSKNSQTVLAKPRMIVHARPRQQQRVVDASGKEVRRELADAENQEPSPSAKQFSKHLTDYYDRPDKSLDFAREFPTFRELLSHAALTSIAESVRKQGQSPDSQVIFDADWLLRDHQITKQPTQPTTPAMVADKQTTSGNVISTRTLTGGVDLTPRNRYASVSSPGRKLTRKVQEAWKSEPDKKYWRIMDGGEVRHVYSIAHEPKTLRVWQTDLQVGSIKIVRDYSSTNQTPKFGRDWSLRVPAASQSKETATFESGKTLPRFFQVSDPSGVRHTLGSVGTEELPGNPAALSYSSVNAQGRKRRLLLYSNAWLFIDGEVKFVSINDGPIQWQLAQDAVVMRFAPKFPNHLLSVQRATATEEYTYRQRHLTGIRDSEGHSVAIKYNADGFVDQVSSSDGRSVAYHYTQHNYLDSLKNDAGNTLAYRHNPESNELIGMESSFTRKPRSRGNFEINERTNWDQVVNVASSPVMSDIGYIGIRRDTGNPSKGYQAFVEGDFRDVTERVAQLIESSEPSDLRAGRVDVLQFLSKQQALDGNRLILVGPTDVIKPVNRALQRAAPELSILVATDPTRARDSMMSSGGRGYQLQYLDPDLESSHITPKLDPGIADGHIQLFVGRATRELEEKIRKLGNKLDGKIVAILTTEPDNDGLTSVAMEYGAQAVMRLDAHVSNDMLRDIAATLTEVVTTDSIGIRELHDRVRPLIFPNKDPRRDNNDTLYMEHIQWQFTIGMVPKPMKCLIIEQSNCSSRVEDPHVRLVISGLSSVRVT